MAAKFMKVKQPPIDRSRRPSEHRPVLMGLSIAILGLLVVLAGALITPNFNGRPTSEWQLVKAATAGGLTPGAALASSSQPAGGTGGKSSASASQPASQGEKPPCPT
jgi:hypothetical protein